MGLALGVWVVAGCLEAVAVAQQITRLDFTGSEFVPRLTIQSELGIANQIQYTNNLSPSNWAVLATVVVTQSPYTYLDFTAPPAPRRFYRVVDPNPPAPAGMVWIPGGTFVMGSPTSEVERSSDETQHTVTVSNFYMSRYEVTQADYLAVVGSNPSYFVASNGYPIEVNRPVEQVSWDDATNYCGRLTSREQTAGRLPATWAYRLPTESEWEYACRAGTSTPLHYGPNLLSGMANFEGHYEYIGGVGTSNNPSGIFLERTTTVRSYQPNAFGLYDMHGNVWEWCLDWHGAYPTNGAVNPRGPASGSYRVYRGGYWNGDARHCRSARRNLRTPTNMGSDLGFRPVLAPGQ